MSENNIISVDRNYYRKLEKGYYFFLLYIPLHFLYRLRASLSFDSILLICFFSFYSYLFYLEAKNSIWGLKYRFETDFLYIDYYNNTQTVIDLREIATVNKKEFFRKKIAIEYKNGKRTTLIVSNPDAFMTIFKKLEGYI